MKEYKKICVCVGHYSKKQGARSVPLGISEWEINSILANMIYWQGDQEGLQVHIIRDLNLIRKIRVINDGDYDICLDLHCNTAPSDVIGHEVLYWHKSPLSRALADCITHALRINPMRKSVSIANGSGSFFLGKTRPIAVLIETCFMDNEQDFYCMSGNIRNVAKQIINGLISFRYTAKYVALLTTKGT